MSSGWTVLRAWWMRDFTVPSGRSISSAISAYSSSWMSRSTSASTSSGWVAASTSSASSRSSRLPAITLVVRGSAPRRQVVAGQLGGAALERAVGRPGAVGGHGVQPGGELRRGRRTCGSGWPPAAARPGRPPRRPGGRAASARRCDAPGAGSAPAAGRAAAASPAAARRAERVEIDGLVVAPWPAVLVHMTPPRFGRAGSGRGGHNTDRVPPGASRSTPSGRPPRRRRVLLGLALPRRRAALRRRREGARGQLGAARRTSASASSRRPGSCAPPTPTTWSASTTSARPTSTPYFVMTYADRGTVADLLDEGRVDLERAVVAGPPGRRRARRCCTRKGVVHRDIKPQNLLLPSDGLGRERLMVADLGVAKALIHASGLTDVVGTPAYMAPEQALGGGIDERADVHGLAAVAYHLLTGHVARSGGVADLTRAKPAARPVGVRAGPAGGRRGDAARPRTRPREPLARRGVVRRTRSPRACPASRPRSTPARPRGSADARAAAAPRARRPGDRPCCCWRLPGRGRGDVRRRRTPSSRCCSEPWTSRRRACGPATATPSSDARHGRSHPTRAHRSDEKNHETRQSPDDRRLRAVPRARAGRLLQRPRHRPPRHHRHALHRPRARPGRHPLLPLRLHRRGRCATC